MSLEQSPAASSFDLFVIKTLVADSLRKHPKGMVGCRLDLIAGTYGVAIDWFHGRASWTAAQLFDDGRVHLVAHEPLPHSE